MGYKKVCFNCQSSFSEGNELTIQQKGVCQNCGHETILLHHKFQAPKKSETRKWKVVEFLVENGFNYQTYWEPMLTEEGKVFGAKAYGRLPETMQETKDFLEEYKRKNKAI